MLVKLVAGIGFCGLARLIQNSEGEKKMKTVICISCLAAFLGFVVLSGFATAAGTADEAKDMVDKALAYIKANGKDKAIEAFNDQKGEFVKGDLYIFMNDMSGINLAHGGNPKLAGKNLLDLKDADGKAIFSEFAAKAQSGGGWVDYKWTNPETKKVQAKSTLISKVDGTDCYIGCGIYK